MCVQHVLFLFPSSKQVARTISGRSFAPYVHAFPFLVLTLSIPSSVITQTPDNQRSFILCLYSPSCKACLCHSGSSNEKASCNESTLTEMNRKTRPLNVPRGRTTNSFLENRKRGKYFPFVEKPFYIINYHR